MKYLLCCLVLACRLVSAETITLGAEDDWAPYSSAVERSARGFAVDVIREAFAAVGVTVNFEVLPYARCLDDTKRGRLVGCFDAVPNAMIGGSFLWHKHPLFTTHMNVYALSDSAESGLTARQLEGKTVGVERGYEYGDEFDLNTKIVRRIVDKNVQGFRMLLAKRIQYMAAEERIAKALFIKEAPSSAASSSWWARSPRPACSSPSAKRARTAPNISLNSTAVTRSFGTMAATRRLRPSGFNSPTEAMCKRYQPSSVYNRLRVKAAVRPPHHCCPATPSPRACCALSSAATSS